MTDQRQGGGYSGRSQQTRTQQSSRPAGQQMPPNAGAGNQAPAIHKPMAKQKLFEKFSDKFGVDQELLIETMKATCFRGQYADSPPITDAQLVMLLIVADQYGLNPFTKEIYAYPDKNGGIVAVVSVDGWIRIINEHQQFNGMELAHSEGMVLHPGNVHKPCWEWMEVTIHRKDRGYTTPVTEYFDEVYRPPIKKQGNNNSSYEINGPWQSHTKRMMRHKSIIQAGRVVFGFAGIYDEDEAERILEADRVVATVPAGQSRQETAKEALRTKAPATAPAQPQTAQTAQRQPEPAARQAPNTQASVQARGGDDPWDRGAPPVGQAEPPPEAKERTPAAWIARMKVAKTEADANVVWDDVIAFYDEAGTEIDMDVEAHYTLTMERIKGK